MRRQRQRFVTILIIVILIFITSFAFKYNEVIGSASIVRDSIGSITAIIGVVAIWYQMKREKDLSEAEFIMNLNNNFTTNSEIKDIYKKLERSKNTVQDPFTEEDMPKIVDYLTFFETISNLIQRRILNFDMINDLFAYRFFSAVHNPHIQRREIIKDAEFYKNLYILHREWVKYRKKNNLHIPLEEFSLEERDPKYSYNVGRSING